MPRYFRSTANKPGSGVRKGYRRGGRNLRDEEARVIGVQDNAADELRRVRARRPHDAAERRDKRSQLSRVGSRERNARDEMARLRGYRRGGPLRAPGVRVGGGPKIPGRAVAQAHRSLDPLGRGFSRLGDAGGLRAGGFRRAGAQGLGMQYGGAIGRQAAAMGPALNRRAEAGAQAAQRAAEETRARAAARQAAQRAAAARQPARWSPEDVQDMSEHRYKNMQYGGAIGRQAAAMGPAIAGRVNNPNYRSLRHYLGDRRGYQYGGAIGRQAAAMGPSIAARANNPDYRSLRHYLGSRRGYQAGGEIAPDMSGVDRRIAELDELAIAQQVPMYGEYGEAQAAPEHYAADVLTSGYIPRHPEDERLYIERLMTGRGGSPSGGQRWQDSAGGRSEGGFTGGRVGFKTGGRISRKKGVKFI